MYVYSRREKRKREEKKDISLCLIAVNKRRVIYRPSEFLVGHRIYFKLVRFTHLLFVLSREDKREQSPDGLDKRKNVKKLDGLRQSCHRQWHSRGGFFPWKDDDWYLAKVAKRMVDGPLTCLWRTDNFYRDISTMFVTLYSNESFHPKILLMQ